MPYDNQITRDDAEALIPSEEVPEIIQGMTQSSVFMQNARRLRDMNTSESELKVLDGLPQAYFVDGDNGLVQSTNMKWKNVRIYAETLACIVPVSENVLSDSNYDIWGEVRPKIVEALAVTFDRATFAGIAAPDRWPSGIIPLATAAGHTASLASRPGLSRSPNRKVRASVGNLLPAASRGIFATKVSNHPVHVLIAHGRLKFLKV